MKKLYKFQMTQEVEEKEVVVTKDDDGNEVRTTKPVKQNKSRSFFLRKPTRKMYDEAELYYGVKLSEGIKAGMMTRALLAKRFDNDGGILSDEDKKRYSALYFTMFELQNEYQRLSLIDKVKRTEEENSRYNDIVRALIDTRERIQDFESAQSSIFDQTAENRARNKTIMWWTLMLAFESIEKEDGDAFDAAYFGEGDVEDRLDQYDKIEEAEDQDDFSANVMRKFAYFVSFWYVGKAATAEEFETLAQMADNEDEVVAGEAETLKEAMESIETEVKDNEKALTKAEDLEKAPLPDGPESEEEPKVEEEPKAEEEPKDDLGVIEEPKVEDKPKGKRRRKGKK